MATNDRIYENAEYGYTQDNVEKPQFKDGDKALEFLRTEAAVGEGEDIDERRLVRKIDFMIVPLMFCCYLLQYLDKSLRKFLVDTLGYEFANASYS
jgi:hypothetical protein